MRTVLLIRITAAPFLDESADILFYFNMYPIIDSFAIVIRFSYLKANLISKQTLQCIT